ncbi:orotate phosphoribosyltransferase [Acidithiobacillus thiooxidans]|uniref:Orotate phosphoribosyltransferase n=1 Tax=Acidithiobacillus thiooxidans ATCC 19377 TaxID=637390 RepID=A0A5P9XRZ1_ACITH|nr:MULTISPECIES: orotate phosphoribosyltransferase [Acidithiobacillus]MBE7565913.1 orotate phosphoribosyltransferase [Acidithiobacillus sp. HP-11]MBU2740288.1 orotate phosphoribosyltransferase [Acidithiobacillus albertensis]MBU2751378.1 orotate phosphoribosyltransferase [Acidithiobacillus thiooxidans]MBU2794787.1 orotate phosphoribosyltransferase [Acidithiobacillus thiooxidans]MBU2812314.1 orotate phosphoribosyltransferase [Acidithiobacillus thiooxidans]
MTADEVVDLYKNDGALLQGHFLLSSGLHSDTYLQSAKVLQNPEHAERLCVAMVAGIPEAVRKQIRCVVGPAMGAVLVSYECARALGVRSLFTERENGQMVLRRGFALSPGEGVLVVEDITTTGGSTRECITAVEAAGGKVLASSAIIDRSAGFQDFDGIPFYPLLRLPVRTWSAEDCPLCAAGGVPVKPGSRGLR